MLVGVLLLTLTDADPRGVVLWGGLALIAALNAVAGFRLTARGLTPARVWAGPLLRVALGVDLIAAWGGGALMLAVPSVPLGVIVGSALVAGWGARSIAWFSVVRTLALRLEGDRLSNQIHSWMKYAGIAAMSLIAGVVAMVLTTLIPILFPFTAIAAVPYSLFLIVLGAVGLGGAYYLHHRLAKELQEAALANDDP